MSSIVQLSAAKLHSRRKGVACTKLYHFGCAFPKWDSSDLLILRRYLWTFVCRSCSVVQSKETVCDNSPSKRLTIIWIKSMIRVNQIMTFISAAWKRLGRHRIFVILNCSWKYDFFLSLLNLNETVQYCVKLTINGLLRVTHSPSTSALLLCLHGISVAQRFAHQLQRKMLKITYRSQQPYYMDSTSIYITLLNRSHRGDWSNQH